MPEETLSATPQEGSQPQKGASGKSGLTPNLAAALSYLLGFITGIVFLLIEKENKFVRFHAMQSTLTFGCLFIANLVLTFIPFLGWVVSTLLSVIGIILWLVLMIKAYQGEEFEVPIIGKIAREQMSRI